MSFDMIEFDASFFQTSLKRLEKCIIVCCVVNGDPPNLFTIFISEITDPMRLKLIYSPYL